MNKDIRIGTLAHIGEDLPEYLSAILPHGFESFALTSFHKLPEVSLADLSKRVGEVLAKHDCVVSSVGLYSDPLIGGVEGEAAIEGIKKCIRHAHDFGCDLVTGFTGRVPDVALHESIPEFINVWKPLAQYASDHGVRIAFENCSMGGDWQRGSWNIALFPAAWELIFDALPDDNIGLEWEPCHQMVALLDPMPQIEKWANKIFHVHGKDATVRWDLIQKHGVFSSMPQDTQLPNGRPPVPPFAYHRTPGFGDTNWTNVISELRRCGYTGSIDIEGWHDPVMKGDLEMSGQVRALHYLKECRGPWVPNPR